MKRNSCLICPVFSKFDFEARPASVSQLNDGINFQSVRITVLVNGFPLRSRESRGIDQKIVDTEGFKQHTEQLAILNKSLSRDIQQISCE